MRATHCVLAYIQSYLNAPPVTHNFFLNQRGTQKQSLFNTVSM